MTTGKTLLQMTNAELQRTEHRMSRQRPEAVAACRHETACRHLDLTVRAAIAVAAASDSTAVRAAAGRLATQHLDPEARGEFARADGARHTPASRGRSVPRQDARRMADGRRS